MAMAVALQMRGEENGGRCRAVALCGVERDGDRGSRKCY
jgi:hypothetical protein